MSERLSLNEIPTLSGIEFPPEFGLKRLHSGKVREVFETPEANLLIVTTDRISAFDTVLGEIPHKGQILNRMSKFWFEETVHISPNHMIAVPDPNVMICEPCTTLPIEVVARAVMKGTSKTSIWPMYERGERNMYGVHFREGYKYGDELDQVILTPTTKSYQGHDSPLTEKDILDNEIVQPYIWSLIKMRQLNMVALAQDLCKLKGFKFIDTKTEWGVDKTSLLKVIDELFTPDSSGFWLAESDPRNPEIYDKEYLRIELKKIGYAGDGQPPVIPQSLVNEISRRYIVVFEALTGLEIEYSGENIQDRIIRNVGNYLAKNE